MSLNKRLMSSAPPPLVASENFSIVTYTGTGSSNSITGVGFQPDWVWIKHRNGTGSHSWTDSTRGNNLVLQSNENSAEASGQITLDSDGFTIGNGNALRNSNGASYVAWCWKANGGTTSSNSDGDITSTVQANTDTGISIVKYDGANISGSATTVGHGLDSAPELIIVKTYEAGLTASEWFVYSQELGNTKEVYLNQTAAVATDTDRWNSTSPTSSVFTLGSSWSSYTAYYAGDTIAYCFHSVEGFSKFGSYTGNGSAIGPIVETGFEPAFLMIKNTSDTGDWAIFDNKRNTANPRNNRLMANLNSAESTGSTTRIVDFLSNGFQTKSTHQDINANNDIYIYMAFAADPDEIAPTLASSFEIQTYDMTGGADKDISFAFKPQFVITKTRDEGAHWSWNDVVRGANSSLASNDSNAVSSSHQWRVKDWFTGSTSVTIAQHASTDTANVSYAWKADDNEPTIFGGPAIAVYKFEDNANDVTGTYNGTASNVSYATGNFNKAANFSTSGANIAIGSPIPNTDTAASVSAWVYLNSGGNSGDNGTVIGTGITSAGSEAPFRVNLRYVSSNTYKITALRQVAGTYYLSANSNITDSNVTHGTWHHVVWTYSPVGRTLTTYLNGSKVQSTAMTTSGSSVNNSTSVIGNFRGNTSTNFNGLIDQVRIYNGVVSDVGVAELYAETVSDNDDIELGGPPKILVSANSNAGFSIVKYTGNGVSGAKVPHGLSAAPDMVIAKGVTGGGSSWWVRHKSVASTNVLELNSSNAKADYSSVFNNTLPSSTVVTLGSGDTNRSGETQILYCFHDVAGYQKFGSYTGSGNTGNTVTVGFKPDFVMVKSSDEAEPWFVLDSKRDTSNPRDNRLMFDASNAEDDGSVHTIDFNSNNFVLDGTTGNGTNGSGKSYIYWALKINSIQIDYLVIAGGGGGGNGRAGGGGAGGYIYKTGGYSAGGTAYTITVGAGGAAGASGSNSVFGSVTAIGGGRGGSTDGTGSAATGGSGGGGAGLGTSTEAGAAGTSGQGNAGGHGYYTGGTQRNGGGGGGSAATGGNASANTSGDGGNGTASSITGSSVTRAGGGGGGDQLSGEGSGGSGGGGNGGRDTSINATAGTANTGSGGGGGGGTGGAGGSGIVILRLLTSDYTGTTTGSPGVTTDGSYTVLQYTSSGTYTA